MVAIWTRLGDWVWEAFREILERLLVSVSDLRTQRAAVITELGLLHRPILRPDRRGVEFTADRYQACSYGARPSRRCVKSMKLSMSASSSARTLVAASRGFNAPGCSPAANWPFRTSSYLQWVDPPSAAPNALSLLAEDCRYLWIERLLELLQEVEHPLPGLAVFRR